MYHWSLFINCLFLGPEDINAEYVFNTVKNGGSLDNGNGKRYKYFIVKNCMYYLSTFPVLYLIFFLPRKRGRDQKIKDRNVDEIMHIFLHHQKENIQIFLILVNQDDFLKSS